MFNFKKKKARYSDRKHKIDRKVISYEDMPLDDYEQERTDISPEAIKKIIIGVAIALAAALAVFAFANRDKLSPENIGVWWNYEVLGRSGGGYPVNLIGSEVKPRNFSVNQGRVAYASDTSFVTLNSSGNEIANVQLKYSKPVMKTCENRFLTYGLGERGYQIESYDSNLYSGDAESVIYTGDIASNGIYCLVTEGNGFLTELFAFDKNNNRIFKYSFSEYYINSVALNRNGTGCVACGITSDGGGSKSAIYVLDFTEEKPVSIYPIDDDSIIDCKYLSSGSVAAVGVSASYVFRIGAEDLTVISYDNKPITNYCFNTSDSCLALALSKSGDGRSCTLAIYNDRGDAIASVDQQYGAESLSVLRGTVAVLDGNMIYAYNRSGELTFSCDAGTGSRAMILNSDSSAYVLSINQVRYLDFKRQPSTADSAAEAGAK